MVIPDLIFAFVIAALITVIFLLAKGRNRGAFGPVWVLFLVFLLATWAGGIWLTPFGPTVSGVFFMPFVIVGIFIALVFAAAGPTRSVSHRVAGTPPNTNREEKAEEDFAARIGVFFWILLIALIVAIIFRYV